MMRVLVAGMGSAIGAHIALRLHESSAVSAIAGIDLEPPRRWIPDAEFHYVQPGDATRVEQIVADFAPEVVVHAWVFEPRARSSPGQARSRTMLGTESLLGAVGRLDSVRRIIVRSGVSIYGRGRTSSECPTVADAARPTSTFGRMLTRVEDRTQLVGAAVGADVVPVRLAAVMASNLPNPLGRHLLLPIVAVPVTSRRFGVVHLGDAARIIAATVTSDSTGPINVMAADPVTPLQATAIGRRVPVPVLPAVFRAGRLLGDLAGRPIPEHVAELLSQGQVVEPTDTAELLDTPMRRSTPDALKDLYSAGRLIEVDRDRLVTRNV